MAPNLIDLLRQAELFARLPDTELNKVSRLLKERRLAHGQVLFRQGDAADALYLVVQGRVRVSALDPSGQEKVFAFLGAGDVIGEMGLLTNEPRSATAVAATDSRLLQLRKEDFDRVLANNVEIMRALLQVVSQRRAATHRRAVEEAAGAARAKGLVTVVFSPRGGAGTTTIATNLAVALAQRAPDQVVLADLNVLFGHAGVLLNLMPRTSLASLSVNALRQLDRESLEFYLTPHTETALRLLTGAMRPEEGELVTGEHVRLVLELLRQHFVHVVVDIGRSFSEVNLTAIEVADLTLLVCTPEQLAVRAARECQRILGEALNVTPQRLGYVLNHPLPYKAMNKNQVEEILGVPLYIEIPFGGDVPTRASLEGQPLLARWPGSPVSKALGELAAMLNQRANEALALAG